MHTKKTKTGSKIEIKTYCKKGFRIEIHVDIERKKEAIRFSIDYQSHMKKNRDWKRIEKLV